MSDTDTAVLTPAHAAALEAVELGLPVFPCGPDKRPLVKWEPYQKRLQTEAEVEEWLRQWPDCNLALATGELSGVDALDFDPGHEAWPPPAEDGTPRALPADVVVTTPREGAHYYCKHVPSVRNSASRLAKCVDVRAEGGYVLIPPSRVNGNDYRYEVGSLVEIAALRDGPAPEQWLVDALLATKLTHRKPGQRAGARPRVADEIPEPGRNDALTRIAGKMRHDGLSVEEIEAALLEVNARRCKPPLDAGEVAEIARSVGRYEPARKLGKLNVADYNKTDAGNGELIRDRHGDGLRFDHRAGKWFVWRRHYWAEQTKKQVDQIAKRAARWRYKNAMDLPADDEHKLAREGHAKWARLSESDAKLAAALNRASSEEPLAVAGDEWNPDPMLLAVRNGVLNLETGELRPGRPKDLITFRSPVAYDPAAECPRWYQFLDEVFSGDKVLVAFIQRAVGYSLTAATSEQVWFFLWGRGANGKGVFIGALQHVFGSYAFTLPFSCFEVRRSEATPNDLAALPGRRLVVAAESGDASTFDSAKLKNLTGEDEIAARFLYREWFHFKPSFKLWLAANRKPRVRDTSEGFWRRCRLIPFRRQFIGSEADRRLKTKLRAESAGILRWAVEGAGYWLAAGLKPPASIVTATEAYRADNDVIGAFLESACEQEDGAEAGATSLYRAYGLWSADVGIAERRRLSQTAFGREIGERFERGRDGARRWYVGVRLTAGMAARVADVGGALP